MGDKIALNKDCVVDAIENLRTMTGEVQVRMGRLDSRSELETMTRYREDLERMSAILESYLELLEEDCGRLEQAVNGFFRFEAGLLIENLSRSRPTGQ